MQSTDLEEIKAALWEQASHPCTRVSWGTAQVMAARKNRGQLRVMLRGRPRWHPVEAVTIERPRLCPTGACDLEDGNPDEQHDERGSEPFRCLLPRLQTNENEMMCSDTSPYDR